jgi:putative spermidine/putrescine transport system permease protein
LALFFALYVAFLYGPMFCIFTLSFQGPRGALVFPMKGFGIYWFIDLFTQVRTGDIFGAISRSIPLALIVMVLTVAISISSGLAFRNRFRGSGLLFYGAVASLVAPGLVLSIGIGLMFQLLDLPARWYTSALGAQLTWTLPFGLLIMFAIFGRFNRAYEEAARDLGASSAQTLSLVVIPIILPGIIAVALFGFTLSYDEFARTLQASGPSNTLPLEIWSMTTNVTSPALYALGTVTTAFSFIVIIISLSAIALIQRRRFGKALPGKAH